MKTALCRDGQVTRRASRQVARLCGGDAAERGVRARTQRHALARCQRTLRAQCRAGLGRQRAAGLHGRCRAQCQVAPLRSQRQVAVQRGNRAVHRHVVTGDQRLRLPGQQATCCKQSALRGGGKRAACLRKPCCRNAQVACRQRQVGVGRRSAVYAQVARGSQCHIGHRTQRARGVQVATGTRGQRARGLDLCALLHGQVVLRRDQRIACRALAQRRHHAAQSSVFARSEREAAASSNDAVGIQVRTRACSKVVGRLHPTCRAHLQIGAGVGLQATRQCCRDAVDVDVARRLQGDGRTSGDDARVRDGQIATGLRE
ncbi:hypothetical protein D3C86_622660 [compost metagenome]